MTEATTPTDLAADSPPELGPPEIGGPPALSGRPAPRPPNRFWTLYRSAGLAAALGTMLWMMWPAFSAKLWIIDDHEIVDMIGRHSRLPPSRIPYEIVHRADEMNGRFRPFYWVIRVVESAVAGHNGTLWFVDRFLLAALAVAAIYLTAVRFMGPVGAYAVSLVPFAGPQWEAYIRLGPNEAYAFPLAVGGFALLVHLMLNGRSPAGLWPGYLLLALSGYTKENFVVLVAFAVPITALRYGIRRLSRADYVVMAGALLVALINVVAILVVVHEYGAVYPQSRTWVTFRDWTTYALTQGNIYEYFTLSVVVSLVLLAAYSTTRRRLTIAVSLVGIELLIALPQLGFYAGNPEVPRYLYPLVLVPTVAWGISLWRAASLPVASSRRLTTAVLLLTLAWPMHRALGLSHLGAEQTATNTQIFQTNLHTMIQSAIRSGDDTLVLQPVNALTDAERTLSVARFVINTSPLHVMVLPPSAAGTGFAEQVTALITGWSTKGFDGIEPYKKPAHCLSVLYGATQPVCRDTTGPPS